MANEVGSNKELERSITLSGAVALVVGGVVGAGIYALVGPIAAWAGGTTWLAFLFAIATSLVGVAPLVQLVSALPRAGAGYLFSSRLLLPALGTVTSSWIVLGGACSTCVVTLAFAGYVLEYVPLGLPPHFAGVLLVLLFYAVYQLGMRMAMGLQIAMAAQLVIALLIYGIAGAFEMGLQVTVRPPQGAGGFGMAVLLCYNTCLGFQVLAEMGEEVRHARRTIPLALLIGGATVAVVYVLIGTVFVNSFPYDEERLRSMNAPLSVSAALFLPAWLVAFVNLGAITAGLTSFNAAAMAIPRELFAMARDGLLPRFFNKIDARTRSPLNAVTVFFLLVVLLLTIGMDLDFYGYMAAMGIQLMTSVICIASMRVARKYPEYYRAAYVHIPPWILATCTVLTVAASAGFVILVAFERPSVVLAYGCLSLVVIVLHLLRVRWLVTSGFPWAEQVATIPGSDEED